MIYFYSTMEVSIKLLTILHSTNYVTNENNSLPIMKSSYYDIDNFKSLVKKIINSFGTLSTNI